MSNEVRSISEIESLAKGKSIEVKIEDHGLFFKSEVTLLFKSVFVHLFTNSMDHGIETPEERKKAGKNPVGSIFLIAEESNSNTVAIRFFDDGAGLNLGALRKKSKRANVEEISDEDLAESIFESGVSTAEKITETSGRGVGMDAVRNLLKKQGCEIRIVFRGPKKGAFRPFEFIINLPSNFKAISPELSRSQSPLS